MSDEKIPARKPYSTPTLTLIGSVKDLTRGNGGTCMDGGGSMTDQNCRGTPGLER